MNRRTFLIGVAATVAVSLPGHTAMGQDAAVIQRAAVRARREFLSRHIDMRTDAYLFDAQDDARAGFTRLSSWAAKPEPNGDIVVGNIEDITETDDGTFGHRGNPSYPEFGSNVWDVRFYRGKRTDAGPGGTVLTMVLLSGPVVHVWRAITSVSDSLLRQIEIFFENYGFPKQQYTDVQLLACLPTVDDLTYLDANISKIKMTLEEVTPLD